MVAALAAGGHGGGGGGDQLQRHQQRLGRGRVEVISHPEKLDNVIHKYYRDHVDDFDDDNDGIIDIEDDDDDGDGIKDREVSVYC